MRLTGGADSIFSSLGDSVASTAKIIRKGLPKDGLECHSSDSTLAKITHTWSLKIKLEDRFRRIMVYFDHLRSARQKKYYFTVNAPGEKSAMRRNVFDRRY